MEENFIERFRSYSDEKLTQVLLHHQEYRQDAIDAAMFHLRRRNKLEEVQSLLSTKDEGFEQAEEESRIKAREQVEHLKTIDFGKYFSFMAGSSDQFCFQDLLLQAEIPFVTSEGFDYARPVVKYHVSEADFEHATWLYENGQEEAATVEKQPHYSGRTGIFVYWVVGILLATTLVIIVATYLNISH